MRTKEIRLQVFIAVALIFTYAMKFELVRRLCWVRRRWGIQPKKYLGHLPHPMIRARRHRRNRYQEASAHEDGVFKALPKPIKGNRLGNSSASFRQDGFVVHWGGVGLGGHPLTLTKRKCLLQAAG